VTRKLPTSLRVAIIVILGALLGGAEGTENQPGSPEPAPAASSAARSILYYRDPGGAPFWSAGPRKDSEGRDYLPVYDDEEPPLAATPDRASAGAGQGRILYYRNPMGLADVSPIPK